MDHRSEQMRRLKELGLSVGASRAYLALLDLGVGEARALSELAGIPTAKVYGTLENLQARGLAEVTVGKPRKYRPVPMEDFLEQQIEESLQRVEELREAKSELIGLFPVSGVAEVAQRAKLASIGGRRNVLQRFRDACELAKEEILVTAPEPLVAPDGPLARPLFQAVERGVKLSVCASSRAAGDPVAIATFDSWGAIFVRLPAGPSRGRRDQASAIYTTERAFVDPLRALLAAETAREAVGGRSDGAIARAAWSGAEKTAAQ